MGKRKCLSTISRIFIVAHNTLINGIMNFLPIVAMSTMVHDRSNMKFCFVYENKKVSMSMTSVTLTKSHFTLNK